MDNRPIAVFDSGLGGLTAVRELHLILPGESVVYFGDTGRVPYGTRSEETIKKYVRQDTRFLMSFDAKLILYACGTASSIAMEEAREEAGIPIFGVVRAAAAAAAAATRNRRVGVAATAATIRGGAYRRVLAGIDSGIYVTDAACPLLVPLVEAGRTNPGDIVIETLTAEYLAPIREDGVDTLILGCTHYPLISRIIGGVMGEGVTLIDSGREAAREVARYLAEKNILSSAKRGISAYYSSDSTDTFAALGGVFLGEEIRSKVTKVDIEKY